MQGLPGLMLDCIRIALQSIYMCLEPIIFPLQRPQLAVERSRVRPLLVVDDEAITTKHHMVADAKRKHRGSHSRDFTTRHAYRHEGP